VTPEHVTVRAAASPDAAALATFGARTFRETYAADNPPGLVDDHVRETFAPELQADELADPAKTYLVAEGDDGRLLGYVMLADTPVPELVRAAAPLQLSRLYVDTPAKRRGVGSRLLAAALEVAAGRGHDLLWLTVWTRNPDAIAAYHRWGFTDVGTTVFRMGDDEQVDRVMVRSTR
jgi:ribosomal protein S18 acetylase RimI-like enzyme